MLLRAAATTEDVPTVSANGAAKQTNGALDFDELTDLIKWGLAQLARWPGHWGRRPAGRCSSCASQHAASMRAGRAARWLAAALGAGALQHNFKRMAPSRVAGWCTTPTLWSWT